MIDAFAVRHAQRARDHVRLQPTIRVREQNPIARRHGCAEMTGVTLPEPAFGQHLDPLHAQARILLCQASQNFAGPVLRAVIHNDHFHLHGLLREEAADRVFNSRLFIPRRRHESAIFPRPARFLPQGVKSLDPNPLLWHASKDMLR